MKYIAIDVGTYSVKFISSNVDKKFVSHDNFHEVIIDNFIEQYKGEIDENYPINEIIRQYFSDKAIDGKIISQVPNTLISTRFIVLPIKNKKKARLILPFQIEEEIPFPIAETNISSILRQHEDSTMAYVAFLHQNSYEDYYQQIFRNNFNADIMTIEPSAIQSYVLQNKINAPLAIIDIGHSTTKAYLFYNQSLVSTHISHIAGKTIDENIATAYNIGPKEAVLYKHQNAFLLTSEQYDEVDENQKEFATLMDRTLKPLISEIRRWDIGFRANYGIRIQNILLTGGSSNLTNIHNYLTESLGVRTQRLKAFDGVKLKSDKEGDKNLENRFAIANLMVCNLLQKGELINFKTGIIGQSGSDNIPIHSTAYLATRIAIIAAIILMSLFIERMVLKNDITSLNNRISKIIQNPILEINKRDQKQFSRKPTPIITQNIFNTLKKKNISIKQEVEIIQNASKINALQPLMDLSNLLKISTETAMIKFTSQDNTVTASFQSKRTDEIKRLLDQFESLGLLDLTTKIDQTKETLNVTYKTESYGN